MCCTIIRSEPVATMMEESVSTFETHLTAVMDSLIRASVCEITKLFQETVNDYLVELSVNRRENEALKLRLRLTENKLRTERKYGMGWAATRRNAGLAAEEAGGGRQKRKVEVAREYFLPLEDGLSSQTGRLTLRLLCIMHKAAFTIKRHLAKTSSIFHCDCVFNVRNWVLALQSGLM